MEALSQILQASTNALSCPASLSIGVHPKHAYLFIIETLDPNKSKALPYLAVLLILVCLGLTTRLSNHPMKTITRLPPGPSRLPLLGNIHQIPRKDVWKCYQDWHQKFGPLIYTKFGQLEVVSVGSFRVANDLLVKRGRKYSSRPPLRAPNRITGGLQTGILPCGDRLQAHRALFLSIESPRVVKANDKLLDIESQQLLHELLHPEDVEFRAAIRRYNYSVCLTLTYGRRMCSAKDELLEELETLSSHLGETFVQPSALMGDVFPVLDSLPRVFTPWKSLCDQLFARSIDTFESLVQHGFSRDSWNWTKSLFSLNNERYQLPRQDMLYITGTILEGAHPIENLTEFVILACIVHEEQARHAQKELETVVGLHRLPQFEDLEKLPYVNAFLAEVMRWRPTSPMGVPHMVVDDDLYEDYHIPKGATIIPNHWSMNFDGEIYDQPNEFRPERWLQNPNLPENTFGFGRRMCVGQHLARRSLLIVTSRLLWAFHISPAVNESGSPCKVDPSDLTQSAVMGPASLKASFNVRSPEHLKVIQDSFKSVNFDFDFVMTRDLPERRG
ncbi:unnamed protein product [Penicillium salamii]|nr:unnamed protein product [Penicillium salamii]